jgi:signal transduction histidine kinase
MVTVNYKTIDSVNDNVKIPVPNDGVSIRVGYIEPNNFAKLPSERYQFKLDGIDTAWEWHKLGDMGVIVRFHNKLGDVIEQRYFNKSGESPGWNGSANNSPPVSRRETLTAPANAATITIGVTSAGPPHSIGTYVVSGLAIYDAKSLPLLPPTPSAKKLPGQIPVGWSKDGTHPSMAKIIALRDGVPAFCIVDDDPAGHAEWRMIGNAPKVAPGDTLTVEWNELYNLGSAEAPARRYQDLPPGKYRLLINRVDANGHKLNLPSLNIIVPIPYWRNPWFWLAVGVGTLTPTLLLMRAIIRIRVRNQVKRLQQKHAVELERLRIARNLHDDLGARLTHISLVSDSAENEVSSLSDARQGFHKLSAMTRELVAILYETVWSVDPENDHLASLVNYLGRMIVDLCEPSEIHCRIHADEITDNRKVTSEIRHNISLAVKEAVHNALKYSHATEIIAKIRFAPPTLTIVIRDNGQGFDPPTARPGHGLSNMQKRMDAVGGKLKIDSSPGKGAAVTFEISIP